MKKPIGIKIIKRRDIAILSAAITPDVVNREAATVCKKTRRELAGRVTDWVREWREWRRIEEMRNIRRFFGEPAALPNAA